MQGLGDGLLAASMLNTIREASPLYTVDVVTTRSTTRCLFEALAQEGEQVHHLPYWDDGLLSFVRSLLAASRGGKRYDVAFLPYPAGRREYLLVMQAFAARAKFAHDYGLQGTWRLLARGVELVDLRNEASVIRNVALIKAAGIEATGESRYLLPSDWMSKERTPNRVLMHAGSIAHDGLDSKRWAPQNFAEVAKTLIDEDYDVSLITGPDDVESSRAVLALEPRISILSGALPDICREISAAAAVLSNDSGIAHLAAAAGTLSVVLFGPTPTEHGPFGSHVIKLRPSECPPCFDVRRRNMSCAENIDYACLRRDLRPAGVSHILLQALQRTESMA
jgi:ADP-heptose:LPS heptosyltransferase